MILTRELLQKYLDYDKTTGIFTWKAKTSPSSRITIGDIAGSINAQGYVIIWLFNKAYKAAYLAIFYSTGVYPEEVVFLDGDRKNCKLTNLDTIARINDGELTQENICNWFHYNTITGDFIRKVSFNSGAKKGSLAGGITKAGYMLIPIGKNRIYAHRLAFLYMLGKLPEEDVDHIDGNPRNNAWENLRLCSKSENLCNQKLKSDNKSGYKGVFYRKDKNKYVAYITKNKKRIGLGHYDTAEEANKAVIMARDLLHKEFSRHN